MPFMTINGNRFYYQQSGSGPDVVLVHAVTGNIAVWMFINIIEALAGEFRVTTYDLRGHGNSDVSPEGYTSADMAEDLQKIHQSLGLGPAYLVGHSFGGLIAMHAAAEYPDLVAGVILSDTYFPGLAEIEGNPAQTSLWQELTAVMGQFGTYMEDKIDFGRLFREAAGLSREQLNQVREQLGPWAARWVMQLPRLAPTTCGDDIFQVAGLTMEKIRSISQPVAALYDEHTPFQATCNFLQENLADCTVEIVPGAKHLAPLQNGPLFVDLVKKHLRILKTRKPPVLAES